MFLFYVYVLFDSIEGNIYIYIYIYILIGKEKIQLNSTIEVQFCVMCPNLFILRESFIY